MALNEGQWSPTTPWLGRSKKTEAYWPPYVCRNPSCKSYGRSHPNCNCGPPGSRTDLSGHQTGMNLAMGGTVEGQQVHFCELSAPHEPGCEHYAEGGEVQANQEFQMNPDLSLDHAIVNHGLLHALTKTGRSKSEDPARVFENHLDSARRGRKELENHSKNILETKKEYQIKSNKDHVLGLKEHLDDMRMNPNKLLDIGGSLGDMLPEHAGALGAKAGSVMNYNEAIRPKPQQLNPMSKPIPPSKMDENRYDRQLAIMQNPMLIYQGVKNGMLQPDDLNTVKTLYPKLYEKMRDQLTGTLIDAKDKNQKISYKHKYGLGSILGQPLDYTQSPAAAQAIIQANALPMSQQQGQPKKQNKSSKATKVELDQINKTDALAETATERLQMGLKA